MPQLLCVKLEDPKIFTSQALKRSRAVIHLTQSPLGCREVNIAEKRLAKKAFIYQETEWFCVVLERSQLSGQSPLWHNLATRHTCL